MTVVFDLDGTTIFKGKKMALDVTKSIQKLSETQQVVFASARPIRDMLPVLPTEFHKFDLIGGNGAFTRQNTKIKTTSFKPNQVQLIHDLIEDYQLNYMLDSHWNYSYKGDVTHPFYLGVDPLNTAKNIDKLELEELVKAILFTTDSQVIDKLKHAEIAVNFHGSEKLIDLSPSNISKQSAFKKLQLTGDVIMFGNDTNDLSMFDIATRNFVVGNLVKNIKNATYISEEQVPKAILSLI